MRLEEIKPTAFDSEKQLQNCIEANLHIFDLYKIKSELSLARRRFDTLCVKDDQFVILEYKKNRQDYQQSQVLNYAETLYKNSQQLLGLLDNWFQEGKISSFVYKSSISALSKLSSPKSIKQICIAFSFDKYSLDRSHDIECYQYARYGSVLHLYNICTHERRLFSVHTVEQGSLALDDYMLDIDESNFQTYDLSCYKQRFLVVNGNRLESQRTLADFVRQLSKEEIDLLSDFRCIAKSKDKLMSGENLGHCFIEEGNLSMVEKMDIVFSIARKLGKKVELKFVRIR